MTKLDPKIVAASDAIFPQTVKPEELFKEPLEPTSEKGLQAFHDMKETPLTDCAFTADHLESNTEFVWRYGVSCVGVRKRCRNRARHTALDLDRTTKDPSEAEAKRLAQEWIAANMKTCEKAQAFAKFITFKGDMETWRPFTDEHNLNWEVTP